MAVNAQSILETIHENAQKNVLTNKVKRAAVPGLSMFGILWYSSGGSYLAHGADTHNATPPNRILSDDQGECDSNAYQGCADV